MQKSYQIRGNEMYFIKNEKYQNALEGAMAEDRAAMNELIRIINSTVVYIATTVVKNHHDGEDAAQEAIIRMIQHIQELQNPESFEIWMYRTVINTAITMKKKIRYNVPIETFEDTLEEEYIEFLPYEYAVDSEKQERLMKLINELPANYRASLLLYYFGGLSYKEVAEALEITENDVSHHLSRARKRIRKAVEKKSHSKFTSEDLYSVLPLPVLTYALRQDMAVKVTPEVIRRVMDGANGELEARIVTAIAGNLGKNTSRITAAKKNVIGVAAMSAVTGVGILLYNNKNPIPDNMTTAVIESEVQIPGTTTAPESAPVPLPEPEAVQALVSETVHEINTVEDLIGGEHADLLCSYVRDGVEPEAWIDFLNAIGAEERSQNTIYEGGYSVFWLQDQNKQLILIGNTKGQGNVEVVYRFCDTTEPIPEFEGVYFNFEEWKEQE